MWPMRTRPRSLFQQVGALSVVGPTKEEGERAPPVILDTVLVTQGDGSIEPGALVAQGTAEAPIRFIPDPSVASPIKGF